MSKQNMKQTISASHDVSIIHNIEADQLNAMEAAYEFMLAAIREAKNNKAEAEKRTAEIIRLGAVNLNAYSRRCIKIAKMMKRGYEPAEIIIRFSAAPGNATDIKRHGGHGRALIKLRIVKARKKMILKLYDEGFGPRPISRMMPIALGTCSPAYAVKVIKAAKSRDQIDIPFALASVK